MTQERIKLLKGLSTGLVVAAMAVAFLIAGVRIFGLDVYGVLTGSMEPTYPTGSMIYVKDVEPGSLRVNDVITFSISANVIATHRIVEIVPDENNPSYVRYRTKGDANNDVDASLVSPNNVIGKVVFVVPQLGYIANYIQQPPGIFVAIFVCGLMIAFVFYTDSLESKAKQHGKMPAPKVREPARQQPAQPMQPMQGYAPAYPQRQAYQPQQTAYPPSVQYQQGYQQPQQHYPRQGYPQPQQTYQQWYPQQAPQGYNQPQQVCQQQYQQQYQQPQYQQPAQRYPRYQPSAPAPIFDQPLEPDASRQRQSRR